MAKIKRSWDVLSDEQRTAAIKDIIDFYSNERAEQIGIIAAENILDMFLQTTGVKIYNKGVEDTKSFIKKRLEEIDVDIEAILKKS